MILSGQEIRKKIGREIIIRPFHSKNVNPNSYDLSLHDTLLIYKNDTLDMKKDNPTSKLKIPPEGLIITPGKLYLGRTHEYTKTTGYIPMLEGRSSVGRLGLFVHVTAGFGDVGFSGYWTLEITCVHPIRIYPFVRICQIYYHLIEGDYESYCSPKYQNNNGIQSSKLYEDFQDKCPRSKSRRTHNRKPQ